jgi:hypothetical protein
MTFAIKRDGNYLSVEDSWVDLDMGLKADTIRGYTEFDLAMADAEKHGAGVVAHPWPAGEQREMFPLWAELGPDGTMKEEVKLKKGE